MKRFAGLILAFAMTAGAFSSGCSGMPGTVNQAGQPAQAGGSELVQSATQAEETKTEENLTPGFSITERGTIDILGAETTVYTHDKTGAKVIHIDNSDKERGLFVTFETPTLNDKGLPHVFEHATLAGSKNYPSSAVFMSSMYQTYNNGMNAMTGPATTSYLYMTMSEEQLLAMTGFYMDIVYYPLLATDDKAFKRESWRYELESPEAPLTINGTVYNEMKGQSTIDWLANVNTLDVLYPDSPAAGEYGGNPDFIPTMTYQEAVDFHDAYYHPSNTSVYLYGDLNVNPFLEELGIYFDQFEKKDIYVEKGSVTPFTEPVTKVFQFPMESGAAVENNGIIYYAVNAGKLDPMEYASMEALANLLTQQAGPVMTKIREALPHVRAGGSASATTVGTYLYFVANGANESDIGPFKAAVEAGFDEIITNGFEPNLVEASLASHDFFIHSIADLTNKGFLIPNVLASLHSAGLGYNYFNDSVAALEQMREAGDGYMEGILSEYIVGNPHTAVVATIPAPGLKEQKDEELRVKLEVVKAAMTEQEIADIVAFNEEMNAMSNEEVPKEMMDKLNAVTVDNLPIEPKDYGVEVTETEGVEVYTAKASINGLGSTNLVFNPAGLNLDELMYLKLYSILIGQLPTENYTIEELKTNMARYLNSFQSVLSAVDNYDFSMTPIFAVSWMGMNSDYDQANELAREIFFNTDLSDTETMAGILNQAQSSARSIINSMSNQLLLNRAISTVSDYFAYSDYLQGAPYYEFLGRAVKELAMDPEAFTAKLEDVRSKILSKDGAVMMFAGDEEGMEAFKASIPDIAALLNDEPVVPVDYDFPTPTGSEGIVVDSAVQSNIVFATYDALGMEPYSGKYPVLMYYLSDQYMLPVVRHQGGAYSASANANRRGLTLLSARDPQVKQTFKAYKGIADFAAESQLTQEDLDRYIISVFSSYNMPSGELNGAMNAIMNEFKGFPKDYDVTVLEQIKTTTVEDFKKFAGNIGKLMEVGYTGSAGGQAAILENQELFDSLIYPLGAQEGDGERSVSRIQMLDMIVGPQEGLYDAVVAQGFFMEGTADDPVTREEFASFWAAFVLGQNQEFEGIADEADIQEQNLTGVKTVLSLGYMELNEDGTFDPKGLLTPVDVDFALNMYLASMPVQE